MREGNVEPRVVQLRDWARGRAAEVRGAAGRVGVPEAPIRVCRGRCAGVPPDDQRIAGAIKDERRGKHYEPW